MRCWVNWRLMKLVIDLGASLRGSDKHVALVLASHAGDDGRDAYPSLARLADECGLSKNTVCSALKRLTKTSYLRVQAPATQHRPTTYAFVLSELVRVRTFQHPNGGDAEHPNDWDAEDPRQHPNPRAQHPNPDAPASQSSIPRLGTEKNRSGIEQGTEQEQARVARDALSAEDRQSADLAELDMMQQALRDACRKDDWRGDCLRGPHGGKCGLSRQRHATQNAIDQAKADARAKVATG